MNPGPAGLAHWQAVALLAFCSLLWSMAGVFTRHLDHPEGFEITFWRSFFCMLGVLLLMLLEERSDPLKRLIAMGWAGLFSGAMWATMFVCFMLALTRTSVANTLLVSSLAPLTAALLSWWILRVRLGAGSWIAIALAVFGIWWMVRDGLNAQGLTPRDVSGMVIALGVPLAAAMNVVMLKRWQISVALAPAVLIGAVLSAALMLPLAWPLQPTSKDLVILAGLGFFQLALPCFLMLRAVPVLAAHEIALISMLEVLLGPLWAWWGAGELVATATLQGGLLVLCALVLNEVLGRWQRSRPTPH